MSLTLRQIEVFRAVMRARSIVGAARELKVAQPTVTKMILRIEDLVRVPLFDRAGGRLTPTAEALRMLAEVDVAFDQLESALGRALDVARSDRGSVRLGASPSVGRTLVPRALAGLSGTVADMTLQLDVLSVSQVLDYLLNGQGEMAVTLFPIVHAAIQSQVVGEGRPVALVPTGLTLADKPVILPSDLAGETLVVFEPGSVHGEAMAALMTAGNVTPARTHVARFAETAVGLAEAGAGVAVVDEFSAVTADREKVAVRPVDHSVRYRVHLHRHVERARRGMARRVEASLRAEIARFRAQAIA